MNIHKNNITISIKSNNEINIVLDNKLIKINILDLVPSNSSDIITTESDIPLPLDQDPSYCTLGSNYKVRFGKYSGKTALDVYSDKSYCDWLSKNEGPNLTDLKKSLLIIENSSKILENSSKILENSATLNKTQLSINEKYYIYILELNNNKYYIGRTKLVEKRFLEHVNNENYNSYTFIYKPIKILDSFISTSEFDEDNTTKKYMKKYGINNVRGGSYTLVELSQTQIYLLQKEFDTLDNKCFRCHILGHFAKNCLKC